MSRRPVLLVHGLGSSFEHNWRASGFEAILEDAERQVLGVELPGHGGQRGAIDPPGEAAAAIVGAAREHGVVDAVGFSAGGIALLVAASRAPELFASIAVLGVGDAAMAENRAAGTSGLDAIADALLADAEPEQGLAPEQDFARLIRRLVRSAGNDPAAVAAYARSEQPVASLEAAAGISARCLLVEGSADEGGPAAGLAAAIPGARRGVITGADHFSLPSDVRCLSAVVDFLDEPYE